MDTNKPKEKKLVDRKPGHRMGPTKKKLAERAKQKARRLANKAKREGTEYPTVVDYQEHTDAYISNLEEPVKESIKLEPMPLTAALKAGIPKQSDFPIIPSSVEIAENEGNTKYNRLSGQNIESPLIDEPPNGFTDIYPSGKEQHSNGDNPNTVMNEGLQIWAQQAIDRIINGTYKPIDLYWGQPHLIMEHCGIKPDPWQKKIISSNSSRIMLLCSRQSGKSQTAACLGLLPALLVPKSTVLVISRSQRQSAELLIKIKDVYYALMHGTSVRSVNPESIKKEVSKYGTFKLEEEHETVSDAALSMQFANGSRIISLPGSPDTLVGYSNVSCAIIDEAARTSDALYKAIRPMLSVSNGKLIVLSTPYGKRGWFWEAYDKHRKGESKEWEIIKQTAWDCPRISKEFLEEERIALGERWFAQEYECEFVDTVDSVFSHEVIHRAVTEEVQPLFL